MPEYFVIPTDGVVTGGPFVDTIQIDRWANENLQVGAEIIVFSFPLVFPSKPFIYGRATVTGNFLQWLRSSNG